MILGIVAGARKAELPQYLAAAHGSGGFSVWPVSPAGFGAKLASPATVPSGDGMYPMFSKTNKALIVTSRSGNGLAHAYPFDQAAGTIGTRMAAPAGLSGTYAYKPGFHPTNNAVAIPAQAAGGIKAYGWDDVVGFGVAFADPTSNSSPGLGNCAAFSPDGTACFLLTGGAEGTIQVWSWSPSGFGARYALPSLVPGSARDIVFTGDSVIISHTTSPYITEWLWSDAAGFGATRASPATPPPYQSGFGGMNRDKAAFIFANDGSGAMAPAAYNYTPGVGIGSAITKAAGLPSGNIRSAAFSKAGDMAAFGYASSPYVQVNSFSAGAFGAKFANPATLPAATVTGVNFTN